MNCLLQVTLNFPRFRNDIYIYIFYLLGFVHMQSFLENDVLVKENIKHGMSAKTLYI